MSVKEDLIAARKLIEDPAHWTQGAYARDATGKAVHSGDPSACKFCAASTVGRVTKDYVPPLFAMASVLPGKKYTSRIARVVDFNDTHTHAEVLALFDRAIEACGE